MPTASTLKEFANAIDTKKTRTMEALDDIYENRLSYDPADVAALGSGTLDTLPPWLEQELVSRGLSQREMNHINKWPTLQKNDVGAKVAQAAAADRPLHFFWDLHEGASEAIRIEPDPDPGHGEIKIWFLSPWNNVKVWGLGKILDKVTVDVG